MTNLPGPGSDPNPVGNLSHMRQSTYLIDMERGSGSSPITGRTVGGNLNIVRGSGIFGANFSGILIDQDGFHVFGENVSRGSFFVRKEDGTLAGQLTRSLSGVDAAADGSVHLLLDNDHELFTLITGGYQQRAAHDIVPNNDDTYYLGDDGSGGPSGAGPERRWKKVHTESGITFGDGTSITTGASASNSHLVTLVAGENLTTNFIARIHTDGKAYHATASTREFVLGRIVTGVSSGANVVVECLGPVVTLIADSAISVGDFLQAVSVTAGRVETATLGHNHVITGAVSSESSHTHSAGTYSGQSGGGHGHGMSGGVSGVSDHTHSFSDTSSGSSGGTATVALSGHSHSIPASPHGATSTGLPSSTQTMPNTAHTHSVSGTTGGGGSHGHSDTLSVQSTGSHNHSISGSSGAGSSHGHSDTFAIGTTTDFQICGIALSGAAGAGNTLTAMLVSI